MTSRMVLGRVMGPPIISVWTATLMLSLEFPVGIRNVHTPNYMKVASNELNRMCFVSYNNWKSATAQTVIKVE